MAEWKLVLGNYEKDIRAYGSTETETKDVYVIVTNDSLQLIIREYIISDSEKFDLEIDGTFYKRQGNFEKYAPDFSYVAKIYNKYWNMLKPSFDIKSFNDVEILYNAMNDKASEIYSMDKYK